MDLVQKEAQLLLALQAIKKTQNSAFGGLQIFIQFLVQHLRRVLMVPEHNVILCIFVKSLQN
jgi:hypothetical protein